MKEFWFLLLSGAAIASPIAWACGRWGVGGFLDRLAVWLGADEDDELPPAPHPSVLQHSNVTVIRADKAAQR